MFYPTDGGKCTEQVKIKRFHRYLF